MIEKIRTLLEKCREFIYYMLFGVLTTVVNYAVYLPLFNWVGMSATVSNAIAWVASVACAFLTNKPFVFHSYDWSLGVVLPELAKFLGTRISSGLLETAILFVTVDLLSWGGNIMKLATSVLVIIINYIGSKLLVFRN